MPPRKKPVRRKKVAPATVGLTAAATQNATDPELDRLAPQIESMLAGANRPREGILATVIGVAALAFAAVNVVVQLKDALNTVWEVAPKPGYRLIDMIRDNALSFAMVLGLGVVMLASLLLTAGVSAVGTLLGGFLPGKP